MRHYYSPSLILSIVLASGAIGFGLGRLSAPSPHVGKPAPVASAAPRTGMNTAVAESGAPPVRREADTIVGLSPAGWINKITAHYPEQFDSVAIRELALRLRDDAFLRQELIRRYDTERDAHVRLRVIRALALSPMQDVVEFALRLIDRSDDAHRKNGFELLSTIPPTQEIFRAVTRAIDAERSPDVLRLAVGAMSPSMTISPADTQAMIVRLQQLTQHGDPGVRAQSLRMLALWDKSGKSINAAVLRALNDTSSEVRQAGLGVVMTSPLRTDSVKAALLQMVNDRGENHDIRVSALRALERFALNNEEYAVYTQARTESERGAR